MLWFAWIWRNDGVGLRDTHDWMWPRRHAAAAGSLIRRWGRASGKKKERNERAKSCDLQLGRLDEEMCEMMLFTQMDMPRYESRWRQSGAAEYIFERVDLIMQTRQEINKSNIWRKPCVQEVCSTCKRMEGTSAKGNISLQNSRWLPKHTRNLNSDFRRAPECFSLAKLF